MRTPARRRRSLLLVSVFALAGSLLLPGLAAPSGALPAAARVAPATTAPNIVMILADDQRYDELSYLPNVQNLLMANGVTFTNAFVSNPDCCPSRASTLTGEYSHLTDIYRNDSPHGGYKTFRKAGDDNSTIATWLQGAGYRTALVGKYLNGYKFQNAAAVPPGWSRWVGWLDSGDPRAKPGGYYKYALSVDGHPAFYGAAETDYSTDVLSQYATDFIATTPADQPLFLYYTPRAPHLPDTPPPRYATACADQTMPEPPSFNEADVSDKPAYEQAMPPLTDEQIAEMRVQWKDDCRSLLAVDDSVGAIVNALDAAGRLSNTMIVYASDNGQFFGEHRRDGKIAPYEEAIRVPIVVRYDPLTGLHAATSDRMVVNIDYAPTWAALAGVAAPGAEGTSFLPLLTDPEGTWRTSFLQEYWGKSAIPSYCGVRTTTWKYIKYATGEEELYDLAADPNELQNQASNPAYAAQKATMYSQLKKMCKPHPPGFRP
jgi:N-acetylglucosamine-6-sulfatase